MVSQELFLKYLRQLQEMGRSSECFVQVSWFVHSSIHMTPNMLIDYIRILPFFSLRLHCTEGRPDKTGLRFAKEMVALGVPVKLLIDSAVAYAMDEVDMLLFGADGVVESGGIINMMGTYQTALVAHSMNKPVYVAAESYKV